jgi:hypothetical protein
MFIDTAVLSRILSEFILMINYIKNVGCIWIQKGLSYSASLSLPPEM